MRAGRLFGFLSLPLLLLTLFWAYLAFQFTWTNKADFDILGIAWLLANLPGLLATVMSVAFTGLTVYCIFNARRFR